MLNSENRDDVEIVVDLVNQSVCATPGRPQSRKFPLQRVTHALGVVTQWTEYELDDGSGNSLGQPR